LKKIEAILRNAKFHEVKASLDEAGVEGLTSYEIKGAGNQKGQTKSGRPGSFKTTDLIPKTKLEIFCRDEDVEAIISTIVSSAKTGEVGDGEIFVSDITDIVRVRTGERGGNAN